MICLTKYVTKFLKFSSQNEQKVAEEALETAELIDKKLTAWRSLAKAQIPPARG